MVHRSYSPLLNLPFIAYAKEKPLTNFEVALRLRFAYLEQFVEGDFFRYTLGSKYPVAEVKVAKGISGIFKSTYHYTKISASVKDYLKISPLGTVSYKVYAGKISGVVPFTFLENHPGNDIYYYNSSAFNLMSRFEYLSDRYAGFNLEHNVGSGIFRFTNFTRKLKWRQFWNIKTLWGSLNDENAALNYTTNNFKTLNGKTYIELGTGIDNILKILRLDFVWRLSPTPSAENKATNFGLFGSFQFQF